MNTIGKIIKKARLDMGLTQEELANKVGVQKSAIAKWENGRVSEIKRSNLKALADALGLNPNVLLGESEPHVTVLPKILPSAHAKTPALALDEQCLVDIYRELNQDGKTALVEYAELISSSDKYKKALSSEPDCG
jgi:transcriptional regulator with XRE-family HTH domain